MSSRPNLWLWLGLSIGGARIALAIVMLFQSDVIPPPATWARVNADTNEPTPAQSDSLPRTSPPRLLRLPGLTH